MTGEGVDLTGWATVALAVVTLIALLLNEVNTRRERRNAEKRAAEERAAADQRLADQRAYAEKQLAEERATADRRLADERSHTERMRQRERQQDSARRLLERLADLLPLIRRVPYIIKSRPNAFSPQLADIDGGASACRQAVERLRFGGVADLPGLRDDRAAEQYRTLVHLMLTAAHGQHLDGIDEQNGDAERQRSTLVGQDLLRYATFVRLSLEHLIEHGESRDPGQTGAGVAYPMFSRHPGDKSLWSPPTIPAGWQEAITRDPDDPQYRPAP